MSASLDENRNYTRTTDTEPNQHWAIIVLSYVLTLNSIVYTVTCKCIERETGRKLYSSVFLADRTNGRAYATVLRLSVVSLYGKYCG